MILPIQLEQFRNLKVWCCYIKVWNEKKNDGKGGWNKPPVNPNDLNRNGSSTDPETWSTFDVAVSQIGRPAKIWVNKKQIASAVSGVGLVFEAVKAVTGKNLLGIDFDNVIQSCDPYEEKGRTYYLRPTDEARALWNHIDSYTEISPSGKGVHILVWADNPNPKLNDRGLHAGIKIHNDDGSEYELYDNARYFTVTGSALHGTAGINARQKQVEDLFNLMQSRRPEVAPATAPVSSVASCSRSLGGSGERLKPNESDAALWEKMFRSKKGQQIKQLYDGDYAICGDDHSQADMLLMNHLAYWTNKDGDRMDRMFRQSGLNREKYEKRSDYRTSLLRKALEGRIAVYHDYSAAEKKAYAQRKEKEEASKGIAYIDGRHVKKLLQKDGGNDGE